jgi:hypothetical protein
MAVDKRGGSLEDLEVMEQAQQGEDDKDKQAALEEVFDEVPPEEAQDQQRGQDGDEDDDSPDDLVIGEGGKIDIHGSLLIGGGVMLPPTGTSKA